MGRGKPGKNQQPTRSASGLLNEDGSITLRCDITAQVPARSAPGMHGSGLLERSSGAVVLTSDGNPVATLLANHPTTESLRHCLAQGFRYVGTLGAVSDDGQTTVDVRPDG
jgi:hypothetical protein